MTSYDEVPYTSHPYPQTQPDRQAVLARLFGMQPPPVEKCRVLELGSASGGNLIPLAVAFPESRFVGIDLSARQIADGQRTIERLELKNIELRHANIMSVNPEWGEFDYVICHGVYSWVPREVQDHILRVCASMLSPQGVAYVSYNTYPGWHLRGTVRDILDWHVRKFSTPLERVQHARAMLDFLVKSVPHEHSPYGQLLKNELELLSNKADSYLLHEHLEKVNEPVYFHQFADRARSHGLQFLSEAELGSMSLKHFPEKISGVLQALTDDFEEMEQYLDFVRNRTFRQTLLCRAEVKLDRHITYQRLEPLYVASPMRLSKSQDLETTVFSGAGGSISTNDNQLKFALQRLSEVWPLSLRFDTLAEAAMAASAVDRQRLATSFVDGFARGFIELHACPPRFAPRVDERPVVSPLARFQSQTGNLLTNLKHQVVHVSDVGRRLLPYLDGENDRVSLLQRLVELARDGILVVQENNQRVATDDHLREILDDSLNLNLEQLAKDALLVHREQAAATK